MSLIGKDLSFGYPGRELLFQHVDIKIEPTDIIGLQGYSGSGKTTLGKVLGGYLSSPTGYVEVDGERQKNKIQFNPVQIIHQHPEKSINPRWKMKDVLGEGQLDKEKMMEAFGINEEWLNRWPVELSGGELQRFCMARAFDKRTKYIIADEITTMLDGITQAKVWETLISLCEQRKIGLVIVSHDEDLLNKLCNKIINFNSLLSLRKNIE